MCTLCTDTTHSRVGQHVYVTRRMCTLCTGTTHPRVGQHVYGPPQPPTAVVRVGFAVRRHDHLRPFRRHHRLQPAHHQNTAQADESAEEGVCGVVVVVVVVVWVWVSDEEPTSLVSIGESDEPTSSVSTRRSGC